MPTVISSYIPFPNIYWWSVIAAADKVIFDEAEHFEKMTYRNKYFITGANGIIQLSIPLLHGRNQRGAMKDITIANTEQWQLQHWRGIASSYRRTPYFEHYEPELRQFFEVSYDSLAAFNRASITWLKKQLGLNYEEEIASVYRPKYEDAVADLRKGMKPVMGKTLEESIYYQPFDERNGFLTNLSMLDLLFCEGPNAINLLKKQETIISAWKGT
ncbi:MAG: WbqC family protein [Flavipsychrobacter sp.]